MLRELFIYRSTIPAPPDVVFRWHGRPGAFERLTPPWEKVRIVQQTGGIRDGARVTLENRVGPLRLRWKITHHDYVQNEQFRDQQVSGPFRHWDHLHRFEPVGDDACILEDRIVCALPLGAVGHLCGAASLRRRLERLFAYRHRVTAMDLRAHQINSGASPMNIGITGASGLVGSTLGPLLTGGGHSVTSLRRASNGGDAAAAVWDPKNRNDPKWFEGFDGIVHLAGENIAARRWTPAQKARIRESRVRGTRNLCEALARMERPPSVLVSASAIGYYGDRGDEVLTEDSRPGSGFLADLCREWESATEPAREKGIRVVLMRFGVILSPDGGALAKMLTPFRLGGGGRLGSGKQYMSWIAIDDAAGLIAFSLTHDSLAGPVNAVSPNPVTNREFTKTLGRVLRRPTVLPMPAAAARLAFGEMADEALLCSERVQPTRALDAGYEFRFSHVEAALRHLLGK